MNSNPLDNLRDLDSPEYKSFRNSVFVRDDWTCQSCNLKNKTLNAHHIRRWADYPHLRYSASNGIALCEECHDMVTGKEPDYQEQFLSIVKKNTMAKYGPKKPKDSKGKYRPRNPRLRY